MSPDLSRASEFPAVEVPSPDGASPVIAQFLTIKAQHKDVLLFFRMGDFYELFFEDAGVAAGALDIALTKRGKHLGQDIPMCGVPVHAADAYLARLICKGHKVAICEQIEDPAEARKRGSKAVVAREVVRIVTPGTLTEDALLSPASHNFLAAVTRVGGETGPMGLAWLDLSTGDCHVAPTAPDRLAADLARVGAGELLVPDGLLADATIARLVREAGGALTPVPQARFDSEAASARLAAHYGVAALDGFGTFSRAERGALGALFDYLTLTQRGQMPRLRPPRREDVGRTLLIDAQTRANLELVESAGGGRRGGLLAEIDQTRTASGARLLCERLVNPLTDVAEIVRRHDAIAFFLADETLRQRVEETLRQVPDLARALQRLALGRGGPRDLAALATGLRRGADIAHILASPPAGLAGAPPVEIAEAANACRGFDTLTRLLEAALAEDLPLAARDGGFIRAGYHAALDEVRSLRDESRRVILTLEARYRDDTGITSLKIRHNNVLGYFIEVTGTHADRMMTAPLNAQFTHRQTLASAARFTTPDLADLESRIARAGGHALEIELDLFRSLSAEALRLADEIGAAADGLARLDVATALARLAKERRWSRPHVDTSLVFNIEGGRHPVVETALARQGEGPFVANDCKLSGVDEGGRLWLVTGPNMAGKSTFLRQTALIAVLAQMGAYVPATRVEIGVVDRLFSRVGAADDLARGRSTFMVEMIETAAILNQAGPRALVILDEIGRGTATYDGLSIAWAALEHLHHVNRARGLFATHYHELTQLTRTLDALTPVTMRVREWKGDVVFLHEVVPGTADRSYGVHVAKLAGLPEAVIARAETVLASLEQRAAERPPIAPVDDLPLFASRPVAKPSLDPLREALRAIAPDTLSPREALDQLYDLVAKARQEL